MPVRRRAAVRKPVARRRTTRRRGMGAAFTKASTRAAAMTIAKGAVGGALASIVTKQLSGVVGGVPEGAWGLAGAFVTSTFLKQPEIAAGMAGYAGNKLAAAYVPNWDSIGLSEGYNGGSMYLQGYDVPMMGGENIYASSYSLAGYEIPGL
jgi:hypothetical protein